MTNGQNWYTQIKTAEELNLNPEGVYYADLYASGQMHPLSVGAFNKFANKAVELIIESGLQEQAKEMSIKYLGLK